MQYMLMIYEDESFYGSKEGGEALERIVAEHRAFSAALGARRVGGAGLKGSDTATTIRIAGQARTVHDGPFAESKEQLGGFYIVDVADLDAAIEIARAIPMGQDGAIEVRPLLGGD
jgi:hypothetical protein